MIYAIPNDGERVANHFVKAPYIAIYSDTDGMLKNLANIAAMPQAGCKAKSQLIQSLQDYNVEAVLVRNIGERALEKLLHSGKQVFRLSTRSSLEDVLAVPREPLTDASQGRSSTNHQKKGGCGSCGCGGKKAKPSLLARPKQAAALFAAKSSPAILSVKASIKKAG
ncbi:NifB/NifX family molybdenum-iron cluster-binding protein [Vibrio parahaemolyticus]|uniref:NifB/NifX family molybdenum-iron cluster-binding protein n=1 Tax=Vibrio parahaemolyticus TaxID=670 RepID=UPI0011237D0B|nr:NifB/NifX family molybdenum-iron cluster-binding protein [Vibrio parahaemolyticus]MBE3992898.1 dinitrogenase iron-molybdenum cofactor [Vibrio parahaemolyticus]MDF4256972.1 NifB/NifX family molybdenum-iron cluster-binding protein [Vibrio parahaemolyticus]MDF4261886.1 NifB/NifX family molybdenum-iron cluster-binding protein [Vibrio parahaemolyticus]MDF4324043.1 NifB/NifX family molybdenum-iron cluster-binding protein [Vibrio parahaemolyticus]MDG2552632.1 NifB/NifX family molybdenum-iron clust